MGGASTAANLSNVRLLEHSTWEEHPSTFVTFGFSDNAPRNCSPLHRSSHVHVLESRRVLAKPGLPAVLEALRMARDARMGKMGCNPASFLQVDQDFAWLFKRTRRPFKLQKPHVTGAQSLAPNQPCRGPLAWNHFIENLALLPHAMTCGRAFTHLWTVVCEVCMEGHFRVHRTPLEGVDPGPWPHKEACGASPPMSCAEKDFLHMALLSRPAR